MSRPVQRRVCLAVMALALEPFSVTLASAQGAHDPLAHLAADVAAVFDVQTNPRLMLAETDHGVSSVRLLAIGDEYLDGWRVAAITGARITLRKGRGSYAVTLTGRTQVVTGQPGVSAAPGALTNAVIGGATGMAAEANRRVALSQAMATGDVGQVIRLGGTVLDVFMATQPRSAILAEIDLSTVRYIWSGDQIAIGWRLRSGEEGFSNNPAFQTYVPPGGLASLPRLNEGVWPPEP